MSTKFKVFYKSVSHLEKELTIYAADNKICPRTFQLPNDNLLLGTKMIGLTLGEYAIWLPGWNNLIKEQIRKLHSIGIYHGDIHEGNIVLEEYRGQHRVYLIDYGLSRYINEIDNEDLSRSVYMKDTIEGEIPFNNVSELLQAELDEVDFIFNNSNHHLDEVIRDIKRHLDRLSTYRDVGELRPYMRIKANIYDL